MESLKTSLLFFIGFLISVFIFLNGFLMNRSEIHKINFCHKNSEFCQYSPYKRIVLILVDALKYEFVDPKLNRSSFYHGNIDILQKSIKNRYFYVNHFIADPPTTTLQRIKALTTGSLPTFIDIGSNFGSSELIEDNIVNQWNKYGFDLKFVGDDTWLNLFPEKFNKSQPYPSFNVKDLDTVDRGVEQFILDTMSKKTQGTHNKPEIILGHMLGIDHCGHTYGKNHRQMQRKLKELNEFMKKTIALMDKETLIVFFGDHGMTTSGDHGGESEEEVDAGFLLVSEKKLNYHRQSAERQQSLERFSQIDIVPTLAALTGVAIPFSNIGVLRPDILTSKERADQYLQMNIEQISQYINSYETKFGSLLLPSSIHDFLSQNSSSFNLEQSLSILRTIQTVFRTKWAQFNLPLIYSGISGCILYLLLLFSSLLLNPQINTHSKIKPLHFFYVFSTVIQIFLRDSTFFLAIFLIFIIIEVFFLFKTLKTNTISIYNKSQIFSVLIAFAYIFLPFSNSFIVSEDKILHFFLQTVLLLKSSQCALRFFIDLSSQKLKRSEKLKSQGKLSNALKISVLLALTVFGSACLLFGMHYKICREEQSSWCISKISSSVNYSPFVIIFIPLFLALHRFWLSRCGNLDSNSISLLNVKYLLPFSGLCLFFYHSIQFVEDTSKHAHIVNVASLIFPRLAVISSCLFLLFLVFSPLMMLHRGKFDGVARLDVPSLFNYLRDKESETCESVIVHGLATIYSSAVFSGLLGTSILVAVFLNAQFIFGIVAVVGFLFVYSVLSSHLHDCNEDDISSSLPMWEMTLVMTLLAQYGFFSTGHQTTISNIPWYSVFVGWSGDHTTTIIPAIMLNINIFSSHILISLFGLLVPLLVFSISNSLVNPFYKRNSKTNKQCSTRLGDFYFFYSDDTSMKFSSFLRRYFTTYLLFNSVVTLGTIIAAAYARRHLMAWKIFVPKMMYSVTGLLVVYIVTALGYLIIRRIHRLAEKWRCKNT